MNETPIDSVALLPIDVADSALVATTKADSDSVVSDGRIVVLRDALDSLNHITIVEPYIEDYKEVLTDTLGHKTFLTGTENPYAGKPLPYSLSHDNATSSLLVLSALAMVFFVLNIWNSLRVYSRAFFMPPRQHFDQLNIDTEREGYILVLMNVCLCFFLGILTTFYVEGTMTETQCLEHPRLLLWSCVGCFGVYYAVKFLLYRFTNWVFFDRVKNFNWNESSSYLMCIQTLLFFLLTMVGVYGGFELQKIIVLSVLVLFSLKILLLYRTNSIFFGKIYCSLHLIAYLCTLEILPMLTLYEVLQLVVDKMITKI